MGLSWGISSEVLFDRRFLPAMDKALAISIGLNGYSQCPMKQGRLSASLSAHECCPLHDDSVQKKGLALSLYGTIIRSYIENEGGAACWSIENLGMLASLFQN